MTGSYFPTLYQVNTRVMITELSEKLSYHATLDDISDSELDKLKASGFDWIWFLSVWQTGKEGQRLSRQNKGWRKEFQETLPDLKEEDIAGSGFAITGYKVSEQLGGEEALSRLRKRLQDRGMKLMLDFVPNHMAPDHPWVEDHPDYFVAGTESDLEKQPQNYTRIKRNRGDIILAYGRDPFFDGWPDTVQLNYGNPLLQEAMAGELIKIAGQCDGVRCDMAMLVLPDVFQRTWGIDCKPFWPEAIRRVHEVNTGFCFMAEVYWDLEWTMIRQGFDYAYDKRLYDRLKEGHAKPVREHFFAGLDYQSGMARFLENHDEPRVASEFPADKHKAAAVITFCSPGLRFFHKGQFEGRRKRISPHLVRAPQEAIDTPILKFYAELLFAINKPVFRKGKWQLLECVPAWDRNTTSDSFLAFGWEGTDGEKAVVTVNYSSNAGQCYVHLPFPDMTGQLIRLRDLMSPAVYERDGTELLSKGLYLDLPAWGYHIFEVGGR